MVTVNGQFPGPRVEAREGDRLIIKVVNHVQNNVSIHWYETYKEGFLIENSFTIISKILNGLAFSFGTGMALGSSSLGGPTGRHTSLNVQYKQGRAMCTTILLLDKEELSGGMLIFRG